MTHISVYKRFELSCPIISSGDIENWYPNGKDSIRLRFSNGRQLIFTYYGKEAWRLETIDSFIINNLKGEDKNE